MRKIGDYKIGQKLNVFLSLTLILIFIAFGAYITGKQKNKIISDTEIRMTEQVSGLEQIISLQTEQSANEILNTRKIAERILKVYSQQLNSNQSQSFLDYLSTQNLYVDEVSELTGGASVSVFKNTNNGFERISASEVTEGKRNIGTVMSNDSEVSQTLMKNQIFTGRAIVVDTWFITSYFPIKKNDEIIGAIGVGVKEKDVAGLRKIFKEKKYFDTGYPFLIDSDGTFIIHPKNEGQNSANEDFFKKMIALNTDFGKVEYEWEGKDKMLFFKYVKSIDSYVAVSIYIDELMGIIKAVRNSILIAILIALIVFVLVIQVIVKSITMGLNKGVHFAESVAQGDLSQTIDLNQDDEVGQLAKALNSMVSNLSEIVSSIIQGSQSIATASQQVSSTSVELSQGASEQASAIEEVSSTMEEISANIEQNTENASQTEKVSTEANLDIKNVASKSSQAVEANKEIASKITVINDIAFQTNLLALNAAVEAARAGEHGKGFAVVAAEVRKLAENSKKAADEIVHLATSGLQISEEAGNVMQTIIPKVENTSKLTQEISAASIEQNNGAVQVNNAIQQLNNVIQQNAAASEELATNAEEMSSQAEQLKEMISFFKVRKENISSSKSGTINKHTQ